MTSRPILFSAPMVRAILAGTKTQTRRLVKPQNFTCVSSDGEFPLNVKVSSPYFRNDVLWVRETWRYREIGEATRDAGPRTAHVYRATENVDGLAERWRPSIHMPRSASRITLRVTSVRVERLQEISFEDACAEGLSIPELMPEPVPQHETWEECSRRLRWPQRAFESLWDSINAKRAPWSSNPWVWAITFERTNG